MDFDYTNIIKIIETCRYQKAQKYIDNGWLLLAAVPCRESEDVLYSLGWSKLNGTPVEPLNEKPHFGIEL